MGNVTVNFTVFLEGTKSVRAMGGIVVLIPDACSGIVLPESWKKLESRGGRTLWVLGRWVFSFSFGLTPSHRQLWLGKCLNCCKSWGRCVKCTPHPWLHFYDSQNIPWPAPRLLDKRRRWVLGKVFLSLPFPNDTALLHCGSGAPLGTISFHLTGRCTVSATLNDSSEPRSGTQPALPLLGEPYFHLCLWTLMLFHWPTWKDWVCRAC